MLPMRSIFLHLIIALLRRGFLYVGTYSLGFDDADTLYQHTMDVCPFISYFNTPRL